METLLDVLTQYAEENLMLRLLREHTPRIQAAQLRADGLEKEPKVLAPEAEGRLERLKTELDSIHICREQASLLAGVSIGLELGRL